MSYSKKERQVLKAIVDWVCLNVFVFKAVLFNFLYTMFAQEFLFVTTTYAVQMLDRIGFEGHFIRFVYMTLFENEGISSTNQTHADVE